MISVIVPVYNVKDYLQACVGSILQSSFNDLEVILIDDGSTDGSGYICDEYASRDERIRVIHKQNGGVSSARNAGIDAARGEYVAFIDGDDMIHPQMFEILVNALNEGEDDYDFSMCYFKKVNEVEDTTIYQKEIASYSIKIISQEDFFRRIYSTDGFEMGQSHIAASKLYKRSFIDRLYFKELKVGEDTEWVHRACMRMKKCILVEKELYYYIQRGSSLTHESKNRNFIDSIRSQYICLSNTPKGNSELRSLCLQYMYKVMISTRYQFYKTQYIDEIDSLNEEIYKKTKDEFNKSTINRITKLRLLLFYHCPWAYRLFMKTCDFVAKLNR